MSQTKLCDRCKRRIRFDAKSCVCGWEEESFTHNPVRSISCCFAGCANSATIRVWTRTGWANVCEADYGRIETVPRVSNNPTVQAIRDAYQRRRATNERLAKEAA